MTINLSEEIKNSRAGVVDNPWQGKDKRVLFICSMGILRSATGARLYADRYNTRSCGTWDDALIPLTYNLLAWANEIVFVNKQNYQGAVAKFGSDINNLNIKVLDIPDFYEHMAPELVQAFYDQYEPHNKNQSDEVRVT